MASLYFSKEQWYPNEEIYKERVESLGFYLVKDYFQQIYIVYESEEAYHAGTINEELFYTYKLKQLDKWLKKKEEE